MQEIMKKNNTWNIRRLVNEMIVPSTQRIILKIVGFLDFVTSNSFLSSKSRKLRIAVGSTEVSYTSLKPKMCTHTFLLHSTESSQFLVCGMSSIAQSSRLGFMCYTFGIDLSFVHLQCYVIGGKSHMLLRDL